MNALLLAFSKETKAKCMKVLKSYCLGLCLLFSSSLLHTATPESDEKVGCFTDHVINSISRRQHSSQRRFAGSRGLWLGHYIEDVYEAGCEDGTKLVASLSADGDCTIFSTDKQDVTAIVVYAANNKDAREALYKKMRLLYGVAKVSAREAEPPDYTTYTLSCEAGSSLREHAVNTLLKEKNDRIERWLLETPGSK